MTNTIKTPAAPKARTSARLTSLVESGSAQRLLYGGAGLLSALLVVACFAAMINVLPDGTSATAVESMFTRHQDILKIGCIGAALLTIPIIWFMGSFGALLWEADTSRPKTLAWIAYTSDLLLMAVFFLEVGLFAACTVIVGVVDAQVLHGLHVAAFTSAYILGPVWAPYFACTYLVSKRTGLMPGWLNALCLASLAANFVAIFGVLTLRGPLNAENGLVSLGGPMAAGIVWLLMAGAWVVVQQLEEHVGK